MDATVTDLQERAARTPEQVIRAFFRTYNTEQVKTQLWEVFIAWTKTRERALPAGETGTKVALLFDQLTALNGSGRKAV